MDRVEKNFKRHILKKFKTVMDSDHEILPGCWIADLIKRLTLYEREFFNRAIEELIQAGLIEQVNANGFQPGLKLTPKGKHLIWTS